jgi:SSS family solute:Na+ symporter
MGRADVVAYLWLNVIGCLLVVIISLIIQQIINTGKTSKLKADEKL